VRLPRAVRRTAAVSSARAHGLARRRRRRRLGHTARRRDVRRLFTRNLFDHGKRRTDGHRLTFLGEDFKQRPGDRRGQFHVHLDRVDPDDRVVLVDLVARLLQPAFDGPSVTVSPTSGSESERHRPLP
jgi:hypothetical protein